MELVKITHGGQSTEVEIKPCRHCGKRPTAEDAEKAVAHERSMVRACAVCGEKPKMYPRHALYHSVDCDGVGGFILCGTGRAVQLECPTWDADMAVVYSSGPAGTVDGVFHIECLKRVAPGITIHPNRPR